MPSTYLLKRATAALLLTFGSSYLTMMVGGTASLIVLSLLKPGTEAHVLTHMRHTLLGAAPRLGMAALIVAAGLWLWDWDRWHRVLGVILTALGGLLLLFLLPQLFLIRSADSVVARSFLIGYGVPTLIYLQTGISLLASRRYPKL